ncbi:MAG: T9SS type A sorting domain-containing protein [Bacteroidales bacterium]|nr:T9SS type A sorting domain-containing protein [Bacteroidales bacterium]
MKKIFLTLNLMVMMVFSLSAQIVEKTFFFDKPNFEEYQGYEQISFGKCVQGAEEGSPVMPWHSVSLLLPQNTEAQDIEFEFSDFIEVEGSHLLYPYQRPRPLSLEEELPFVKNESVYASEEVYPSRCSAKVETQYLNGYSFAFSGFTPVRYVPATGKVSYAKTVTVRVKYVASKSDRSKMLKTSPEIVSRVERLAQNPEDVRFYSANGGQKSIGGYELMVITPEEWVSSFDEYKEFYNSQGLRTKVFSLESIYASSEGRDDQEKIRSFIANEYENEGVMMVLLGGDSKLVPYRGLYCYVMEDYEDELPADMYYVCLDGTWNDDNDESWGEPGEDDLLPELAIGRMPFNTETQFNNMMHKTLEYQRNPVLGEFNDIVFGAEHLGDGYYGSTDLELLIGEHDEDYYTTVGIPADYNIHRVYANGATGWSGSIFREKINEVGGSYVHHVGHANTDYVAGWYVSTTDHKSFIQLDGVNHNYNFFHSHGCVCGDFTSTCILERLVNISTGFVAATGNSRYGWYIPWGDGPARHLHREFVDAYYHDRLPYIGTAFVEMKIATAPYVADMWGENGALRWNMYCINILGDVAVKPWLDEPFIPEVSYDLALNGGATSTEVAVRKNNEPQSNFRCSLYYGDELLAFGMTNENGEAELIFDQALDVTDTMQLIVTGPNAWCQTYEVLGLNNQSSFVYAKAVTMEDDNNNSLLDYSENISLNIDFYNAGLGVNSITSTLTTISQDYVEIVNDEVNVGNIGSNSTKSVADAFSFKVKDGVPDQEYVFFTITSTDGSNVWSQDLVYRLQAPVFEMYDVTYDDGMGNDNGFVDAGETIKVYFRLKNVGSSISDEVFVAASSSNQYVTFDDGVSAGVLNVDQVVSKYVVIEIDENTPDGEQFTIDLNLTSGAYEMHDQLRFTVGTIKEDFETGDFSHLNWKFDFDLPWIVTKDQAHTGNYCVESGHIGDDEISSLLIDIENTSNGEISFYFKTSTEFNDYFVFYIDGELQNRWSGENDWQIVSYDVPAGVHTFEWRYDKSVRNQAGADRCWVDDIEFPSNSLVLDVNTITESKTFDIYPNPAENYIVIEGEGVVEVEIFDMMGRKILTHNVKESSVINVNDFSQGLYLIRSIDVNNNIIVKKFVKE